MKFQQKVSRRHFIGRTAAGIAVWRVGADFFGRAKGFASPNERPRIGVVGTGSRWEIKTGGRIDAIHGTGKEFVRFGDLVSLCDVDAERLGRAKEFVRDWSGHEPAVMSDYRKIIDDPSIDIVHISTPDHWHAKIAIEAMRAGKDVYCEKPMTLTVEEGRRIIDVQKKCGAVFQVGTQQRSIPLMLQAVALVRSGRLGKIRRIQCAVGTAPTSPEIPAADVPASLDWDRWLGPAPWTDFRFLTGGPDETGAWSRCHYEFRWWYEYSGGKMTDWGAHHVDIAAWAIEQFAPGPIRIEPLEVTLPVEFKDGYPVVADRYNTAEKFKIRLTFTDGMELLLRDDTDNGILFEGSEGRIFVNRGKLNGKPVEELADNPLPDDAVTNVYGGEVEQYEGPQKDSRAHIANFFSCAASRKTPVSDVASHHRSLTLCHLAAIAARIGRPFTWDPERETVTDDAIARSLLSREKRKGYEIED